MRDTREIKFRGRRICNGEWVYGWLYSIVPYGNPHERGFMIKEDIGDDYEVDPESVGQYSGVNDDDKDEELFSGDIIQVGYDGETIVCEVMREGPGFLLASGEFDDGYIWISEIVESLDGKFYIPDSELLGNRWEHPHLLGGNQA
jgi:hypothetical protein